MTFSVKPHKYNNTCYIVAGGPSLKEFDWSLLTPDKFVIAINRSYEVLPNAQVVYFTDKPWWEEHKTELLKHKGKLIRGVLKPEREMKNNHPRIELYHLTSPKGYVTKPGCLAHGSNSTYAALNLAAAHFKFKTIYLLGVDMKWGKRHDKTTSHWHSGHKRLDAEGTYKKMIQMYDTIREPLIADGVKVYNASPSSALNTFEKVSLEEVFKNG